MPTEEDNLALALTAPVAEVAGLFDPNVKNSMTANERGLLSALLVGDVTISPEAEAKDLWDALIIYSRAYRPIRDAQAILKLLIGRALIVIQNNRPEIWQSRGFRSFDAFLSDEDNPESIPARTKISRGELYKAKTIAENLGDISSDDVRQMGFTNMSLLAAKTKAGNADFPEWVEKAKALTIPKFKIALEESNLQIPAGSMDEVAYSFLCTKDERELFVSFMLDPEIHAHCGTERPGGIMGWLIAEAMSAGWKGEIGEGEAEK